MIKDDGLHINLNVMLSYNKPFNFCISEREAGKSVGWVKLVYNAYKKWNRPSLVIRRQQVDITDVYIQSIIDTINDFCDDSVCFECKSGKNQGALIARLKNKERGEVDPNPFIMIIALSNPLARIKSLVLRGVKYLIFDEFIVNTRDKEKYLPNEAFKFKELWNTFYRHASQYGYDAKALFFGNPYSKFNPYFSWLKVDLRKVQSGTIINQDNYVVWCYKIKPELKEAILKRNPLYEFDDSYKKYAFDGMAINDKNIRIIEKQPNGMTLQYGFRYGDHLYGVYTVNGGQLARDYYYWIGELKDEGTRRSTYCFDFAGLADGTTLISVTDKKLFRSLRYAIGNRSVTYESLEADYAIEDIFTALGGRD